MPVVGSLWPQWGHLPRSSQDAHCGGSHSQVCALSLLHQVGCPPWILVNCPRPGVKPAYDIQQSLWKIPFPATYLGLVCSQDIFQKKMDQILEECQECIGIADDITIHGHTEAEHDTNLWNLMWIAHKYNLVFNPQKTHVKAQAINFFGCFYDANGVHLDLGKVDAIHALPVPTNVTKLQEFLGLVTYLSPFIPGLSTLTAPCMSCSRRTQTSTGAAPMMPLFSMQKKLSSTTPPSDILTLHFLWQYKVMPHR